MVTLSGRIGNEKSVITKSIEQLASSYDLVKYCWWLHHDELLVTQGVHYASYINIHYNLIS